MSLLLSFLPCVVPRVIQDHDKALYPATSMPEDAIVTTPEDAFEQLPAEIIGEIFLQCLPHTDYFVRPRRLDAPMVLCSVSRRWREVALSTPALWSSISVLFLNGRLKPNTSLVQSWSDRSGQHPLSIELVVEEEECDSLDARDLEILAGVFQILIPAYKRWRHARFNLCSNAHAVFASFPNDGTPLLEFLDINLDLRGVAEIYPEGSAGRFPDYLQNIFHDSPLLRSLTCKGTYVKAPSLFNTFNRALTELTLDCQLATSECLLILTMCPKLETCTFHQICKISSPDHPLPSSVTVASVYHNLRRLRVETGTPIPTLFQSLTLPSLESLTVLSTTQEPLHDPLGAQAISNMIMRSSPPLQALTLENIPFIEENMIQLLHSLDSLSVLDLNDEGSVGPPRLSDKIVLALAGKRSFDNGTFLCPKLEVLRLCGRVATRDGVFAEMITLRLQAATSGSGVARLKAVHVEFGCVPQYLTSTFMQDRQRPLDNKNLKQLRADGLNVRFFSK